MLVVLPSERVMGATYLSCPTNNRKGETNDPLWQITTRDLALRLACCADLKVSLPKKVSNVKGTPRFVYHNQVGGYRHIDKILCAFQTRTDSVDTI